MKISHDPLNAAIEIREQLASEARRLLFFFGAGTSMAVGLPGIIDLTKQVSNNLKAPTKTQFESILKQLPDRSHLEMVLDRVRTLRELIGDSTVKEYDGLKGNDATNLDLAICQAISEIVRKPAPKGLAPHRIFSQWLRALHSSRDWPVEVFTTNYDLFFEQAMEDLSVPFFDGFVGSVAAFFSPESVQAQSVKKDEVVCPPRAWTRFWKLHGSVNWCVRRDAATGSSKIVRVGSGESKAGDELAIFPSRDKYSQSRKLPFLALQDRLRECLSSGESLLLVTGYSFSDQHLNDILFQGLRSNPRLAVTVLLFDDQEDVLNLGAEYRNLTVYAASKACVGGLLAPWGEPRKRKDSEDWPFWDEASKKFKLGDFSRFTKFLEIFVGFRSSPSSFDLKPVTPSSGAAA